MPKSESRIEIEHVACEMCLSEVPQSVAVVPEAADYVVHFCGLPCFERLKNLPEAHPSY